MKIRGILFVIISTILVLSLTACGGGGGSQQTGGSTSTQNLESTGSDQGSTNNTSSGKQNVIKLKYADFVPTTNDISKEGSVYFMNRVKELTNGQVDFEYYAAEQLGKAKDIPDVIKNKTADIGIIASAYTSDKFPLSGVAELPDAYSTVTEGANAIWKVTKDILLEEEFLKYGVRPLAASVLHPYPIFTKSKKVVSVEDWKGLKLRVSGGAQELTVTTMGAAPVAIASPDIFAALQRGTLDGGILGFSSWKPYQIEKMAKYATTNINLGTAVIDLIINEDVYQKLPDEVKKAFDQAGEEMVKHFSSYLDDDYNKLIKEFSDVGVDMYQLDDKNLAEWKSKLKVVDEAWIKNMEKKGLPGQKVYDAYHDALKQ